MAGKKKDLKGKDATKQASDRQKLVREAARIVIASHREALKELARH